MPYSKEKQQLMDHAHALEDAGFGELGDRTKLVKAVLKAYLESAKSDY